MKNSLDRDAINALPMDYEVSWFTDYHCRVRLKSIDIDVWPTSCKMMVKSSNNVIDFEPQDFKQTIDTLAKV